MSYIQRSAINGKRYIPVVRVSFHTETECYQVRAEVQGPDKALDPTSQLLSVTTNKTLQNPAGTFSIQLIGDEWMHRLKPNDVVVISMGYKSEERGKAETDTIMVGLIDRIRRSRSVASGTPVVQTTVAGRDFGKVFLKAMLKFYPEIGWSNTDQNKFFLTEEGWLTLNAFFTGKDANKGTPAVILDIIMRNILPKLYDVEWTVYDESHASPAPKRVGLMNILRYNFAHVNFFTLPMYMTMDTYEGSIWNLMERTSPKPFTELFIDTRSYNEAWNPSTKNRVVPEPLEKASDQPDTPPVVLFGEDQAKVVLSLRNTPFDRELWENLYQHDLQAEDVISEDLEMSDDEHVNLFWAGQQLNALDIDLKRVAPPLLNEDYAKRFGLSPMEVEVEGFALDPERSSENAVALHDFSQHYSRKLKNWFENNHLYLNGTMEVRGKGSYRIGQRLLREGIEREFYIEGVTQSFQVYRSWTTTLMVTRGMPIGSQPLAEKYIRTAVASKSVSKQTDEEIKQRFYTIKAGDTLWKIAVEQYGSGEAWTRIWEANKEYLIERDRRNEQNPGAYLYEGQTIRLP